MGQGAESIPRGQREVHKASAAAFHLLHRYTRALWRNQTRSERASFLCRGLACIGKNAGQHD